jgi:hypothetical protein
LKREDAQLDELLARGTLGGPHYDEIFERALARTEVAGVNRWRWWRWVAIPGAVIVPAVAAWLLFARPAASPPTPKGAAGGAAAFEVGCGASGGHVCRPGDTLMFSVNAAVTSGYLGAYAERVGDPARERIWYFPTAAGLAPAVSPAAGTVVLSDGIHIGPEHIPGQYRITIWTSAWPFARREIEAADPGARAARSTIDIQVVP